MNDLLYLGAGAAVALTLVVWLVSAMRSSKTSKELGIHEECGDCNAGSCEGCSVYKYPDSLGDLDEDHVANVNWSSGQDDVPPAPDGMLVFSEGKVSQALKKSKGDDVRIAFHLASSLYGRLEHLKAMSPAQLEVVKLAVKKLVDHLERAHKL